MPVHGRKHQRHRRVGSAIDAAEDAGEAAHVQYGKGQVGEGHDRPIVENCLDRVRNHHRTSSARQRQQPSGRGDPQRENACHSHSPGQPR
jgi:hypothetical protein